MEERLAAVAWHTWRRSSSGSRSRGSPVGPRHLLGLPGRGQRQLPGLGQFKQRPVGHPQQGGQGIEADVNQQLFPQSQFDVRLLPAVQAGPAQRRRHPGQLLRGDLRAAGDSDN